MAGAGARAPHAQMAVGRARPAVVRVRVTYRDPEQEYLDLWELDFTPDGRVEHFVEWAYWPGKSFTA